jgi:addiction module HigA family antidote
MDMHDPAHPGEIVREECLKPLGLTVTAAAEALGVTRKALSDLLNGHSGVSPDMAIRLEKVFGGTADTWLRMQMQRELWEARQRRHDQSQQALCYGRYLLTAATPSPPLTPALSPRAGRGEPEKGARSEGSSPRLGYAGAPW